MIVSAVVSDSYCNFMCTWQLVHSMQGHLHEPLNQCTANVTPPSIDIIKYYNYNYWLCGCVNNILFCCTGFATGRVAIQQPTSPTTNSWHTRASITLSAAAFCGCQDVADIGRDLDTGLLLGLTIGQYISQYRFVAQDIVGHHPPTANVSAVNNYIISYRYISW